VNENSPLIQLSVLMGADEGWGRAEGRVVYGKLVNVVESHPGATVFRLSMVGINRVDISFASETVIEIARRFRGIKGFCFVNLADPDLIENWNAAAERKKQPLMVWNGDEWQVIGEQPSKGTLAAFQFALTKPCVKASEFAAIAPEMSITNASTKFKQLWEQGFLLRREGSADSGGLEFEYHKIG
jgi:hypothetical protein